MGIRIIGSGSFIPEASISNTHFKNHIFLDEKGQSFSQSNEVIIENFSAITGIAERRYAPPGLVTSDLASLAAQRAIDAAGIDPESLDYIIVAHNFGDVQFGKSQSDMVPSLASRVKKKLGVDNPKCVAYDVIFGCPGWIEAMIQAKAFIRSGIARRCLVVGAECLSRVVDAHDRDAMIYADGAGATIVEASADTSGLLSHESASFTLKESDYLYFGSSNNTSVCQDTRYIKMYGRKIYEFALTEVPKAMKNCLERSGIPISAVNKILIHQANEKMDEAIVRRFYSLFDKLPPTGVMPMIIGKFGNSSVATIPTLYDLIASNSLEGHSLKKGDIILFASVGAGMNVNAIVYRV